ncbi:MAG: pafB [Ilumatobacteraceae bacterium]|nr:pafB [Ilumatobacteraceae bacterium]
MLVAVPYAPSMAEPLERMTNLLALLLETKVALTLQQIVGELGGQYPTNAAALRGAFERDKSVLREIGVPIEQEVLSGDQAGQTAYRIDRRRYELADLELDDDERRALQLAVAAVRSDESWGREGLLKLGAGGERPSRSVAATVPTFDALPVLREAVATRATARFTYRDQTRRLDPYGLLLRDGYWYAIGHDHTHDQVRTYRVDRIVGDVSVGDPATFERPADFDIRTVFPADPKLLGESEGGAARAVVRIDATRAPLVAGEVGEAAIVRRLGDGAIEVEVPCLNRDAFRSWLLGLTDHAVVISPPDLRAEVIDWLSAFTVGAS